MKHKALFLIPLVALMASCLPRYTVAMKGVLCTDATKTVPAVGDTLAFYQKVEYDFDSEGGYLGYAITDAEGRWAFAYENGIDNPYKGPEPKLSIELYTLLIRCGNDTLYTGSYDSPSEVLDTLYPGCWERPTWTSPYDDEWQDEEGGEQ